jgi:probable phosphoglycerate mutase
MKIYFVRHGHPDYENDCLTELGHKQAVAAAERLKNCGIEQVFSSTKGRAFQTAEYTAKALGLQVISCDFMREIGWRSIDGETILANGHPWNISDIFASEGKTLTDKEWYMKEPYCKSNVVHSVQTVKNGLDAWLAELGYQREGEYYRVVGNATEKTIAMFSHAGSSSVALSHILNIPFPQICGIVRPDFTSITVLEFSDKIGELIFPKLLLLNDVQHTKGLDIQNIYEM